MSSVTLPTLPTAISSSTPLAHAATAGSGTTTSTSQSSTNSIGSTFLSLLVQELQNQDPTAPMDSTAMVGQMISLNQLDQLTSINQTLTNKLGSTSTTSAPAPAPAPVKSSQTATAAHNAQLVQTALQQLNNGTASAAALPGVSLPAF